MVAFPVLRYEEGRAVSVVCSLIFLNIVQNYTELQEAKVSSVVIVLAL